MLRVFIDSSVFFAAIYSSKGYARDLLDLALRKQVTLVVSQLVLIETRRNLAESVPDRLPAFDAIVSLLALQFAPDVTPEETADAASYTAPKDAPIIAAARKSRVDYLTTYDRRHLLNPPEVAERSGLRIVLPDAVVRLIQQDEDE